MPIARTAGLLAAAVRDGRGQPAFDVITLEHAEAIAASAELAGHTRVVSARAVSARAVSARAVSPSGSRPPTSR